MNLLTLVEELSQHYALDTVKVAPNWATTFTNNSIGREEEKNNSYLSHCKISTLT